MSALDRRLPVGSAGKESLRKAFPDHWSFLLGGLALYSPLVLVLTGVLLTFFFHPDLTERPVRRLVSAVVLPAVLFLVLSACPFSARWITGPRPERQLCNRPRSRPDPYGAGCGRGLRVQSVRAGPGEVPEEADQS